MKLEIGKLYHFSDEITVPEDYHSMQEWSVMDKSGKKCVEVLKPFIPFVLLEQKRDDDFDYRLRILTASGKSGFIHVYKNELRKFFAAK